MREFLLPRLIYKLPQVAFNSLNFKIAQPQDGPDKELEHVATYCEKGIFTKKVVSIE